MKTATIYFVSALLTTIIVIFWILNPSMTSTYGIPVKTTVFLVGAIICGYAPLVSIIIDNILTRKRVC